ncbi:MAG: TraB/GumN family protein [Bacteroidota bacterium]|nr:TraB/GumN family protein [Bacteroidota bacterium]
MKRIPVLLCLALFCLSFQKTHAQTSSLLWEISSGNNHPSSYLFGTFHLMCKDQFTISTILEDKIRSVKQFYGELKMDDPNLQQEMMSKMQLRDQTLQDLIGAEAYPEIRQKFETLTHMPLLAFDHFKPFFCLSLLALQSVNCQQITQPETELMGIAGKYQIPIKGLETVEDQLSALDKEPMADQIQSLKRTVLNFDSVKTMMHTLTQVYLKRNIDTLYRFMQDSGLSEDFETVLLKNRNENWIPVMVQAMKTENCFFAVGAGHLGGKDGLIQLLRTKGYRVTPVKY